MRVPRTTGYIPLVASKCIRISDIAATKSTISSVSNIRYNYLRIKEYSSFHEPSSCSHSFLCKPLGIASLVRVVSGLRLPFSKALS